MILFLNLTPYHNYLLSLSLSPGSFLLLSNIFCWLDSLESFDLASYIVVVLFLSTTVSRYVLSQASVVSVDSLLGT